MKKIIYLIMFIYASQTYGQGQFGNVTPQTAEFIKYGEIPISLYTGKLNNEIPIYHIKDKDFDIPISIVYTSDGFKLNQRATSVGMNWLLNVGGVITREVYGAPDDAMGRLGENKYPAGFYTSVTTKQYAKDKIWQLDQSILKKEGFTYDINTTGNMWYDWIPDLFSFNVLGQSAQFMIDNNGAVKTNINGYKVNLEKLAKQYTYDSQVGRNPLPSASKIEITAPNGYVYTFGGGLDALEFSRSYGNMNIGEPIFNNPVILGWHLSEIKSPNGRKVKFNYCKFSSNYEYEDKVWQTLLTAKDSNSFPGSGYFSYSDTKVVLLESIEISDTNVKIEFAYSSEKEPFYTNQDIKIKNKVSYQLDKIQVKQEKEMLFSYDFAYEYKNRRRFLSSFTENVLAKYRFEYNHPNSYSEPTSASEIDENGYWNAQRSHYGVLNCIKYPTGGYTKFMYENHSYSKKVETYVNNLKSDLVQTLVNLDGNDIGGIRIRKIENYTEADSKAWEKEYYYVDNYSISDNAKTKTSSGILLQDRPYTKTVDGKVVYWTTSNLWSGNYNVNEPYIGYSTVIEYFGDKSHTRHYFSNYETHPNRINYNLNKIIVQGNSIDASSMLSAGINKASSFSFRRGLLLSKTYFDNIGKEIQKEEYKYRDKNYGIYELQEKSDDPTYIGNSIDNDCIISFHSVSGGAVAKKIYLGYCPQVYKKITQNNVILQEQTFKYNKNDLIEYIATQVGITDIIKDTYKYLSDDDNSLGINLKSKVLSKNILDLVVEETKSKNAIRLNTKVNNYKLLRDTFPVIDYVETSLSNNILETRNTYPTYDDYGNPIYVIKDGAINNVYLWSYNGQYPIAEIKNTTYEDVFRILGYNPEFLSRVSNPNINKIAKKIRDELPLSHTTFYSFKPLVGLISSSDESNLTTYYTYNKLAQLVSVKNNEQKIIQSYQYKFYDKPLLMDTFSISHTEYPIPNINLLPNKYNKYSNDEYIYYMYGNKADVVVNSSVSNGSGNYIYSWSVTDINGKNIYQNEQLKGKESINFPISQSGKINVTCLVLDIKTGELKQTVCKMSIEKQPTEFCDIKYWTDRNTKQYFASANIYSPEASSITFYLKLDLPRGAAEAKYTIGTQSYILNTKSSETVTLALPAGYTPIKFSIYEQNLNFLGMGTIQIQSTTKGSLGANLGLILPDFSPLSLNVN